MPITYTDPGEVVKVKATPLPTPPWGTYGPRIPSRYMILYLGSWRRVYVMQYANSGSAYVTVRGFTQFVDDSTERRLQQLA